MKFLILVLGLPLDFANRNSDGWCIQSGTNNFGGSTTITLKKPFKDTNYTVSLIYKGASNTANTPIIWHSINSLTTTSFTITNSASTVFTRGWVAMGYVS